MVLEVALLLGSAFVAFVTTVQLGDAPLLDTVALRCQDHLSGQQKLTGAG